MLSWQTSHVNKSVPESITPKRPVNSVITPMLTARFQKGWWGTGPSHAPHPMLGPEQRSPVSFPWEWGRTLAGSLALASWLSYLEQVSLHNLLHLCVLLFSWPEKQGTTEAPPSRVVGVWDNVWTRVSKTGTASQSDSTQSLLSTWWKRETIQPEKLAGLSCAPSTELPLPYLPWRVKERVHVSNSPERVLGSLEHFKM